MVELDTHSPICLHGVVKHRDNFTFTFLHITTKLIPWAQCQQSHVLASNAEILNREQKCLLGGLSFSGL
jgi:hypothetical protein